MLPAEPWAGSRPGETQGAAALCDGVWRVGKADAGAEAGGPAFPEEKWPV